MRFIRFSVLVVTLFVVYLAQYIFDYRSLNDFFPVWFLDTFPSLYNVTRWLPEDLMDLATALTFLGALAFGLLTTPWVGEYPKPMWRMGQSTRNRSAMRLGMGMMAVAGCFALYLTARVLAGSAGSRLMDFMWLLGGVLYLLGSVLLDGALAHKQTLTVQQSTQPVAQVVRPESSWPQMLLILVGALFLFGWGLGQMPGRIEPVEAQSGLQALALARNEISGLFLAGADVLPPIVHWPAAISMRISGRVLWGARFSNVLHGLLMVVATWLLSCELFRRVPRRGQFDTVLEDDGRWVALLAAMLAATGHVAIHFSRISIYLVPTAWGILGLWMLLRGLRTSSYSLLALSGLAIGLAGISYASGLLFWIVAPLWWLGIWLLRRSWIDPRYLGMGMGGAVTWGGAFLMMSLPVLGDWLRTPDRYTQFVQSEFALSPELQNRLALLYQQGGFNSIFSENFRLTLQALNAYPDVGALAAYPAAFLHSLTAPLFFLALGGLLLNLDRLPGWLLLSYLGGGLIYGAANAIAPSWSLLLPIYPIACIFIAFALDRIRLTLLETLGTWLEQTSFYVAVGLILWVGVQSWTTYYEYAHLQTDAASVTGRAIAVSAAGENAILLVDGESPVHWANPVIEYTTSNLRQRVTGLEFTLEELPDLLLPNAQLFIQPQNGALLPLILQRYPNSTVQIERDLRGNILLYMVH